MSDVAELRLQRGDPEGALTLYRRWLTGLTRPLDAAGGSALAYQRLGDTVQARERANQFLEMLDGGARGYHPARTNGYRLTALEILSVPEGN